ncbi:MAG TPA: 30S ribosome-binding factor RbfA [Woeseiaceae bacterium]|nr:30S ribosome-binding factor RbfA [Woeseiaceae bacterium]
MFLYSDNASDRMPREFSRHQRLGAQVQRSLSGLLRFEVKDPGLKDVSLTAVDLSRDLSVARVYFSLLDPDGDPVPVQAGLERAAGFLRRRLGRELEIRHVPELRFVHDDSIAHGFEISRLIDSAKPNGDDT